MVCRKCGMEVMDTYNSCPNCGEPLNNMDNMVNDNINFNQVPMQNIEQMSAQGYDNNMQPPMYNNPMQYDNMQMQDGGDNKKSSGLIIIIICIVVALVVCGVIIAKSTSKKNKDNKSSNETSSVNSDSNENKESNENSNSNEPSNSNSNEPVNSNSNSNEPVNSNSNSNSNTPVTTKGTTFKGFVFQIPDSYKVTANSTQLQLISNSNTDIAIIDVVDGDFDTLKSSNSTIKSYMENAGYTVGNIMTKKISGVDFIYAPVKAGDKYLVLSYAKLTPKKVLMLVTANTQYKVDYSQIIVFAPMVASAGKTA